MVNLNMYSMRLSSIHQYQPNVILDVVQLYCDTEMSSGIRYSFDIILKNNKDRDLKIRKDRKG